MTGTGRLGTGQKSVNSMINEYKIKLSGTACIHSELNLSKQYDLTIGDGEIVKSQDIPTEDGKIDRIYTVKITEASQVNLIRENEVIQTKKKGSLSQKLRSAMHHSWTENPYSEAPDFEEYYKNRMIKLIEQEINGNFDN